MIDLKMFSYREASTQESLSHFHNVVDSWRKFFPVELFPHSFVIRKEWQIFKSVFCNGDREKDRLAIGVHFCDSRLKCDRVEKLVFHQETVYIRNVTEAVK